MTNTRSGHTFDRRGESKGLHPHPNLFDLAGQVTNSSRIPVIFAIDPPKASSGVFRVSPIAGLLLGNQTATLQVIFAPRETKEYQFRLPVKVQFQKSRSGLEQNSTYTSNFPLLGHTSNILMYSRSSRQTSTSDSPQRCRLPFKV